MNTIQPNTESLAGRSASPRRVWLISALLLATGIFGMAQATNETPDTTVSLNYSSFKIITDRNIFDPNRFPHSAGRHESSRAPAVDSFSLAGTMIYQKGRFAFFDGTHPDYRKILEPGGLIVGYKVTEITPGSVKLEAAGKQIEFKVGTQMRHEDDGTWQMVAGEEQSSEMPADNTEASPADTDATPAADSSLEANDVLKRLMQKRQQELK